ncbi:hypothetical protein L1987_22515 [Smallanthus sonchifolius]|uniref:Uncharacterized protein n=1 Tax=Smallanthus sonchifolius TaxID=185202 RepID=A0ACB9IGI9_9ASTR|nr:hypothetical protein L1987_22515 [Smallanthus sonchifolius]
MGASMERDLKHNFDRQESWNRTHAYAFEQEVNNRYLDDQNRRMHDDWHAGRPVVADPPLVDYSTLPPYDGSVSYPTPPLHHSQWVDPRQIQQCDATQQGGSEGGSGSGSGAFAFGEFSEMMTSIFGPPQPRLSERQKLSLAEIEIERKTWKTHTGFKFHFCWITPLLPQILIRR